MCQMCDEYENELVRMGLIEDATKFREERERDHATAAAVGRRRTDVVQLADVEAPMDDKVTVEFDSDTMDALSQMAEAHGRGIDAEIREIVSRNVRKPMTREEFVRRANEIAALTPRGVVQTDSALLVREDRDR